MQSLMEGIVIITSMILTFGTFIAIFLIVSRTRQRRAELQAQVQTKLIERFGSAKEMVDFLHSQAGRDFVSGVQSGTRLVAGDKVLSGIRRSIVLSFAGIAFLALWGVTEETGLAFPGFILLALGVGYFAASMVSMKMSQQFVAPPPPPPLNRTDASV